MVHTVVLTGATGAIGNAIARGLVADSRVGKLLILCRDTARGEAAARVLRRTASSSTTVLVEEAQLDDPASVAVAAARIVQKHAPVHALINNAAVVPSVRTVSPRSGLELQFAVNVLAYFVLMRGLLPGMRPGSRVVNVASDYQGGLDVDDLEFQRRPRRYSSNAAYKASKMADRLLSVEAMSPGRGFAEAGVAVAALHPGVVTSTLLKELMGGGGRGWDTAEDASLTPIFLALDWDGKAPPSLAAGRVAFWKARKAGREPLAAPRFATMRKRLWEACEEVEKKRRRGRRSSGPPRKTAAAGVTTHDDL